MEFFHRPEDPNVGYWGPRTSAVDWCEPNYTWTFYVAEFFNTMTSLPAALLALNGIWLTYKYGYDKRYFLLNFLVGMVGIGSAAFHGTLLYTGQILDELPMVYTSLSLLHAVLELESSDKPIYRYLSPILLGYAALFTGVYLYLPDFFIFFLVGYILLILTLIVRCAIIYRQPATLPHQKTFIIMAVGFYVGGWLGFWVPEILFCDKIQALNFHAFWHVTSTLGAFVMVVFLTFQREIHRGRKPQLNYNTIMGVPILPYVHIPALETKSKNSPKMSPKEEKPSRSSESWKDHKVVSVLKKKSAVR